MAGRTDYKNQWLNENKERINFVVEKGKKDKIKAFAKSKGLSMNSYITELIEADMGEAWNN